MRSFQHVAAAGWTRLYTTGVALQATMLLSSSSRQPWHSFQAEECIGSRPEQCLPVLQHCIAQLGSILQQLASACTSSDEKPVVQGTKQLRVVLGKPVFDAYNQLVAAAAAAAHTACEQSQGQALQLGFARSSKRE